MAGRGYIGLNLAALKRALANDRLGNDRFAGARRDAAESQAEAQRQAQGRPPAAGTPPAVEQEQGETFDPVKAALDLARESRGNPGDDADRDLMRVASLSGGDGGQQIARRAIAEGRATQGRDMPATPGNAQTALDKYLRSGGVFPSPSQLSTLGLSRDDVQAMKAEAIMKRRMNNTGRKFRKAGIDPVELAFVGAR